jgi:XTP/dITP diphosphohydrolase
MSIQSQKLLIATNNPGKVIELTGFALKLPLELFSLADFPNLSEVQETGETFDQNARLKASGYAVQTGLCALADDSGLEVAALENRPGVLSARYGGAGTSFAAKMAKLAAELDRTGDVDRRARFVCSMAISDINGRIVFTAKGICDGKIASEPRGKGGFGYDPLFIPDGFDLTFGELPEAVKQKISHRARAFEQIIPFLRDFSVN